VATSGARFFWAVGRRIEGCSIYPNKVLWKKGDFAQIGAAMREGREALIQAIAVVSRMKLFDRGCGYVSECSLRGAPDFVLDAGVWEEAALCDEVGGV
jgi:hypothetical protein